MKSKLFSILALVFVFLISTSVNQTQVVQEFQAKAYYFSKSKMDLGKWGARLSEAQKKEVEARMKNKTKELLTDTITEAARMLAWKQPFI